MTDKQQCILTVAEAHQKQARQSTSPFATEDTLSRSVSIDFGTIVEQTKEDTRHALNDERTQEYIEQYCTGNGLIVTHPFTGEQINVTEQDLGDDIAEQEEKEEEVIDETNPFDGDDDDDAPGGDEPLQGTIG